MGQRGEIFTTKVFIDTMKKTYFFNVKENRYRDIFLNIVETKKRDSGGFNRHSMMVYKEDLEAFSKVLGEYSHSVLQSKSLPERELLTQSGKRKYHFIIKTSYKGDYFLIVTESRKNNDLAFQNESIRIYGDQIQDFQKGYDKALKFVLSNKDEKDNRD